MSKITKEIDSLRAKIARLEKEQKKIEEQEKALAKVQDEVAKLFKESGISLETYIRTNYAQISRIVAKLDREKAAPKPAVKKRSAKKRAAARKRPARTPTASRAVRIPAGKYGNLPSAPERIFEVKEKGPRPKALKAYAEEVGLEVFFKQCRIDG